MLFEDTYLLESNQLDLLKKCFINYARIKKSNWKRNKDDSDLQASDVTVNVDLKVEGKELLLPLKFLYYLKTKVDTKLHLSAPLSINNTKVSVVEEGIIEF